MFDKYYLDNGMPVLFETISGIRSVVVGIWVKAGSRNERPEENGIAHFIEHMVFKGTRRRTAENIAQEIDQMGGDLNAYTSRENTTFYIKVLDEYLDKGLDLLTDIFLDPLLDPDEINKERGVIEEEIRMVEDTPDELVFDLYNADIWGPNGLGQSILGTTDTLNEIGRESVIRYIDRFYTSNNVVISCAGNIDKDRTMEILRKRFSGIKGRIDGNNLLKPDFQAVKKTYQKDLSEVHICTGFEGIPVKSPEKYQVLVLNTILGSGVSSRLFQEIREKRGLVYSISSFVSSYFDTGTIGIYAGAGKNKYREVIDLIKQQAFTLKDTITDEDINRTKKQLKGNIILSLESSTARMNNIARQEIYYGRYLPTEEIIAGIEDVRIEDVRSVAERIFRKENMAMTLLGPAEDIVFE